MVKKNLPRATTSAATPSGKAASRALRLSAGSLDTSVGYSLRRAQLSTYDEFTQAMEPFDIRPSQFTVLTLIQSHPGLTQSGVCSALGIQKTNFVALLDKLDARGLTERRKVRGDRRSFALYLTEQGESFVSSIKASHQVMEERLATRLGSRRTREFLKLLHEFTAKGR